MMICTPSLIELNSKQRLPKQLLLDLQLDKILTQKTLDILRNPCKKEEIKHRAELFETVESKNAQAALADCLSELKNYQRTLALCQDAEIPLERAFLRLSIFEQYITICERLASFAKLGYLLGRVSHYFLRAEKQALLLALRHDLTAVKAELRDVRSGLLSFSDKHWITPDRSGKDEYDELSVYALGLGLEVPDKKKLDARIDQSLSDAVSRLHTNKLAILDTFVSKYAEINLEEPLQYIDAFEFIVEINVLIKRAGEQGIPHCYPSVADQPSYMAKDAYDLSLMAKKLQKIIPNDIDFNIDEPFSFLTGANGGGKTTYLRSVGINLVLFLSGCPVFAREANLFPFEFVASHFPMDERFDGIGRLDEERLRVDQMLSDADGKSTFLLFNETFSGTDEQRGYALLCDAVERLNAKHCFGLYVTHFHEVNATAYPVLSAQIDAEKENERTYRIVKTKGNSSSYALDILKKYGLDKASLDARR